MDYGDQADKLLETIETHRRVGPGGTNEKLVQLAIVYALRDIGEGIARLGNYAHDTMAVIEDTREDVRAILDAVERKD